ncbi:MAG TPA: hypothetical protein VFO17_13960 [Acidimicrobiia bacterium]|jgi:hypothetical protein|nr:hypothetical protein [Acidimicrobiia bacterium]
MITWRMAAGWVAALVAATVLAWQIVGLADSQVGDATPEAVAPTPTSTTTTVADSTTTTVADSTTSTGASATTAPSSTTPTTGASTPTTESAAWSVRTINSSGGVVVIRYRPQEVDLQAATPASGFGVEIDDPGPSRVRVEFENDDDRVRVEARWENGQLVVEVD